MLKNYSTLLLMLFCCSSVKAQLGNMLSIKANRGDTAIFYYKYPNIRITTDQKPDYIRIVYPPDAGGDNALFVVREYYANGKLKMIANAVSNVNPVLVGSYIQYFPNGKRERTGTYAKIGEFGKEKPIGLATSYYPNGKVLIIEDYLDGIKHKLIECRDSTGTLTTDKGNGKWVEYYDDFKTISREGAVTNGLEENEWHESRADTINYTVIYKRGKIISGITSLPSGKHYTFTEFDAPPKLRSNATESFFKNNFRYESLVLNMPTISASVSFKIDETGKLYDVKLPAGDTDDADIEALRVVNKSAGEWTPAYVNGIPKASECEMHFRVSAFKNSSTNEILKYYVSVNWTTRTIQ